jgi:CBS domain-containing protein
MLVGDIMQTEVTTATPATTVPAVLRLLERRRVRHIPVSTGRRSSASSPTGT